MHVFEMLVSLLALIMLEVILGIDNLVFISILTEKLPIENRKRARRLGLMLAWVTRLLLLASAIYIVKLANPFIFIGEMAISWRDLLFAFGGMFLIAKATQEIHSEVERDDFAPFLMVNSSTLFHRVVVNIALMDIIFSLDSVLTAVGLTSNFYIMAIAITFAILVMIYLSEPIARFISAYPTVKMLALSFLILIGMVLIADSLKFHVPRGYIYFAMGFSLTVEGLNILKRSRRRNLHL